MDTNVARGLCQVLAQTLAPNPHHIRAAEAQLLQAASDPQYPLNLLAIAGAKLPFEVLADIQQAAAISLKNYLHREWSDERQSVLIPAVREQLRMHLIPTLLETRQNAVKRHLTACLSPLCHDQKISSSITQSIVQHLHLRCQQGMDQQEAIISLIRCFKISIRACSFVPSNEYIPKGIELLFQLLKICTDHRLLLLRKTVSQTLLIAAQTPLACSMIINHWQTCGDAVLKLILSLVEIVREVPAGSSDEIGWQWKTKSRVITTWLLVNRRVVGVTDGGISPLLGQVLHSSYETIIRDATVMIALRPSALSALSSPSSSSSPLSADSVHASFDVFALAMMQLIGEAAWDEPLCISYFAKHADSLLAKEMFQFLCVNDTDITLLDDDPEEYSNRCHDELRISLVHYEGSSTESNEGLDEDDAVPSTVRGAAILAVRDLVHRVNKLPQFLEFLETTMKGLDYTATKSTAICCGAFRAFAAVTQDMAVDSNPQAEKRVIDLIQDVLIPAASVGDVALAVHMRCVASSVLARLLVFLSMRQQHQLFNTALRTLITRLCDNHLAVRKHAVYAFLETLRHEQRLLDTFYQCAPACLAWLVEMLESAEKSELLVVLSRFLNKYCMRLGDLDPSHADFDTTAKRNQSILSAHTNLFRKLTQQFFDSIQAIRNLRSNLHKPQYQGQAQAHVEDEGVLERRVAAYIEALHALSLSAPKENQSKSIHSAFLPHLVPFAATVLMPDVMQIATKLNVHIDAMDTFELFPVTDEIIAELLAPLLAMLKISSHIDLLVIPVCKYINLTGSKYLYAQEAKSILYDCIYTVLSGDVAYNQCCISDLIRTLALATACEPGTNMVVLGKVDTTAVAFRRPYIQLLLHFLQTSSTAANRSSAPLEQLPVRLMCAICAMLYVDPSHTWLLLQETSINQRTGEQLFLDFWTSSISLLLPKRALDVHLCLLGVCAVIKLDMKRAIDSDFRANVLIRIAFALFSKCIEADNSGDDTDDASQSYDLDDLYNYDPEESIRDSEHFPEMEDSIPDDASVSFIDMVKHLLVGDNGQKQQLLAGMVGPVVWSTFVQSVAALDRSTYENEQAYPTA
eukprot:m.9713 g.9713  ORF g.9713 m.9713 type:complete len:1086 (-) comp7879_c0_seq1:92-3349(-)